jgi:hypothetical protein
MYLPEPSLPPIPLAAPEGTSSPFPLLACKDTSFRQVKDGENANAEWRENSRIRCCFIVDLKYHGKARKRTKRPLFRCLRARSAAKYLFLIEFLLWLFALLLCLEFVVVLKLWYRQRDAWRAWRGVGRCVVVVIIVV